MNAVILQGWKCGVDEHWYPWLAEALSSRGIKTSVPDLPTIQSDCPDLDEHLAHLKEYGLIDSDSIVFGHSLGALLAMRVAETQSYKKMFLIAGWDFNDLTVEHRLYWETDIKHDQIKENVREIYCFSSDNDPYITAFTIEQMAGRLGGQFVLLPGKGHFTSGSGVKEIPELLEFV